MKTDSEIQNDIRRIEEDTIDKVCFLLSEYHFRTKDYIADITASLCGISKKDMLTDTRHIDVIRARWLYWYGYRYMFDASYESIAKQSGNRLFTTPCVGQSVAKMSSLIDTNTIWKKRWSILKNIIKLMLNDNDRMKENIQQTITLKVPKNINVELKKE
jgi:chromosomal replication initiation ATPase DnaA